MKKISVNVVLKVINQQKLEETLAGLISRNRGEKVGKYVYVYVGELPRGRKGTSATSATSKKVGEI